MKNLNEPRKRENEVIPFERSTAVPPRQMDDLHGRWTTIQSSFVDGPREAVEEADNLMGLVIKQIEEGLMAERANLKKSWESAKDGSTEDYRICLQKYREYFDRLVSKI